MRIPIEQRIYQTGLQLYESIKRETPSIFQKQYWTGKVLDWCMKNESFKVAMFRFVDVYPYLRTAEAVTRHMQEYFGQQGIDLPRTLLWGIKSIGPDSITSRVVANRMEKNITNMAFQFIAGATPQEALPKIRSLRTEGIAVTVDLLGEAVVSEREADEYVERYLSLLDLLADEQLTWTPLGGSSNDLDWGHAPKINVSIKPSAMYSQMNPSAFEYSVAKAKERLRPIFSKAVDIGAFICMDMEHRQLKNLSLALYRSLLEEQAFRGYPHAGIVIQAYLRESDTDLKELIRWAKKRGQPINVRLVKGAYWDAEVIWAQQRNWPVPVFTNKHETDANFERLAQTILRNHQVVSLACASHNIRSIAAIREWAKELKVPDYKVEYQLLYGMAEPIRTALLKAGFPLRLYSPVGELIPGMAYLVRRLLENTANESFLRHTFSEQTPAEILLENPLELMQKDASDDELVQPKSTTGKPSPFVNEPHLDWTLAENRESFAAALAEVRDKLPFEVPIHIGEHTLHTSNILVSRNPNDPDEIIGRVCAAEVIEAEQAVETAAKAFPSWRDTSPEERAEYLFRAAAVARNIRKELAAIQVYEVGKAWAEADADVCEAIDFLEYYGRQMLRLGVPRKMGTIPGENSHLFYEPRGVAVVIAPWNFPMAISVGMASAALVAGNTVIYKPASQSPVVGSMVWRIFQEAKLPNGVLNFLPGSGAKIGDSLITHPLVALIAFTGSMEVGLRMIELAGKTPENAYSIKKIVAELGGKNAVIIDSDADLDEAVIDVIRSAFGYQGQKCSACSRVIVLEEIYDRFTARLRAAAESIHMGPVEDPRNMVGAVIDAGAQEKTIKYINIAKKECNLLLEKWGQYKRGYAVPITIFVDVDPDHPLAQEEIFAPVLAVIKVPTFEEALKVANATKYALTGAVFSRSPLNIEKARREFRVGNLYINRGCTGALVGRHPFGGYKMSGVGSKAGGPDYLLQFMVARNVVENTIRKGFAPIGE